MSEIRPDWDSQFAENEDERNERLAKARRRRAQAQRLGSDPLASSDANDRSVPGPDIAMGTAAMTAPVAPQPEDEKREANLRAGIFDGDPAYSFDFLLRLLDAERRGRESVSVQVKRLLEKVEEQRGEIRSADHNFVSLLARQERALERLAELEAALLRMTEHYTDMIKSGGCGNWDPEKEEVVIAARAALAASEVKP